MTVTPDMLGVDQKIRDMLWPFDFAPVDNTSHGPVWMDTAPLAPFEVVGQRGSGCVFALVGPQRHVLLLTSEGQAGIVAASLQEWFELLVAHPYWEQIAARSEGDLVSMRKILEDEGEDFEATMLDDNPEIEDFRPVLRSRLGLGIPEDPCGLLHRALTVIEARATLRDLDGQEMEPLFGERRWR